MPVGKGRLKRTIFPLASDPRCASSSNDETTSTSAVIPSGGVPTLVPRPSNASLRGDGEIISAASCPRTQTGTRTGSVATFSCPSATKVSRAHSIAWASAGEPVGRGPNRSASAATRR